MIQQRDEAISHIWDPALYDTRHAFVWQHGSTLIELLAPQFGEHILDLGCGSGHLTAEIAGVGARVVGLDSSSEMLAQARQAHPNLDFVQGDASAFHFPEPFDAVFSNAVLHWIPAAEAVARCVAGALKPGGRFVAEFGGKGNVQALLQAMRSAAMAAGVPSSPPAWYFPGIATYAAVLESAGLEVRQAVLFDRPTPLEGETGLRDWVRMFARHLLDQIPEERIEMFFDALEGSARPTLHRNGGWIADYRRLRFVAIRND